MKFLCSWMVFFISSKSFSKKFELLRKGYISFPNRKEDVSNEGCLFHEKNIINMWSASKQNVHGWVMFHHRYKRSGLMRLKKIKKNPQNIQRKTHCEINTTWRNWITKVLCGIVLFAGRIETIIAKHFEDILKIS